MRRTVGRRRHQGARAIFHLFFAIPCLYVIARWVWPLTLSTELKVAVTLLLLVGSQFHLWSRLSSGSVFAPEFPRPLVLLFNWAFGAIVLLAMFQLLLDLGWLASAWARRTAAGPDARIRYAIGALAAILAGFGVWNAVRVPPLKDVEITVRGLPREFDGYRLVQLTDLHISKLFPAAWTRSVVERTNAAGADLIVVTGDFIDGSVAMRRADIEPLRGLRAADGVYAIPGNHEYFFSYRDWMQHLSSLGMRMLPNAHAVLVRNGGRLVVAGVTDLSAPSVGEAGPDLVAALKGAPADAPILLLDHQPRQARKAAAAGVAVQLSGHTHGGMIVGLDRLVAPANSGFVSGRYQIGRMTLYVNNGTALWPGFALRLGRPSELTRITLRSEG
nr:metallophosphoesterase [Sphingomonas xinjiangensis]